LDATESQEPIFKTLYGDAWEDMTTMMMIDIWPESFGGENLQYNAIKRYIFKH